jgi:hypothetical protein
LCPPANRVPKFLLVETRKSMVGRIHDQASENALGETMVLLGSPMLQEQMDGFSELESDRITLYRRNI